MKNKIFIVLFLFCTYINYAQNTNFDAYVRLFKKTDMSFAIDSCSVEKKVWTEDSFPSIDVKKKKFIPTDLHNKFFVKKHKESSYEQFVRAYYNVSISDKYTSLIVATGIIDDNYRIEDSSFYLLNYDKTGNIVDYIDIAGFRCEAGCSWCHISNDTIMYETIHFPLYTPFEYDISTICPMEEEKIKYVIDSEGHFTKDTLFHRRGIYNPTDEGNFIFISPDKISDKKIRAWYVM